MVFNVHRTAATRLDCIYSTRLQRVAGHVEDGQGEGGGDDQGSGWGEGGVWEVRREVI